MALETWLTKVKSALRSTMINSDNQDNTNTNSRKKSSVGILAFEISSLMSKLVHLWRSLSDAQISRLRHETIALEGVRRVVSDDDAFLLGLACAEIAETLRLVAESTSNISKRSFDQQLRGFGQSFKSFADSGEDPNRWVMSWKEMDSKAKKMDRYIASTAALYKEMDELADAEHGLRKLLQSSHGLKGGGGGIKIATVADVQQKIFWQRQEVKCLKQSSLWGCTFDAAISLLARSSFTILARIKQVFGISNQEIDSTLPLPRSLSAVVYPSSETPPQQNFVSVPLSLNSSSDEQDQQEQQYCVIFELSSNMIMPPASTLGAAALALHYANVIAVIEKMIRTPRAVGPDARDDLYSMLPASVRGLLRNRLRGVGWGAARDAGLAAEWRAALNRIVEWLGPVAHNTVRWQGERSFERRSAAAAAPKANVLLLQTLYFANREKVEAAIAELLVGLNYVWRFEMETFLVE